jgi:hypothetical protein
MDVGVPDQAQMKKVVGLVFPTDPTTQDVMHFGCAMSALGVGDFTPST